MTRTFSTFVLAILRVGALVFVVVLLSGHGLAQQIVTARATIPFNFWAQGHEFQAGDYVFDNEVPGSAAIHREGTNSANGVPIILYAVPEEKETPRVLFVLRDKKYFLFELWSIQGRYVVTAEFEHRGEASEQQRQAPLTIVESHDLSYWRDSRLSGLGFLDSFDLFDSSRAALPEYFLQLPLLSFVAVLACDLPFEKRAIA
jgi:hypothetical protein